MIGSIKYISDKIADLITRTKGLDNIYDLVNAILDLTPYEVTITPTDGTDNIVYQNDAPASVFNPKTCQIDLSNMAAGDTVVIKVSYRIKSAGSYIMEDTKTYNDAQSDPKLKTIRLNPNRRGVKITLAQTAGAPYKAFDTATFYLV